MLAFVIDASFAADVVIDIEDMLKTIAFIKGHKWTSMMVKRVYFGNWLREYATLRFHLSCFFLSRYSGTRPTFCIAIAYFSYL